MNLSDAHKKSSELSRVYPGRKWAVVKAFHQVGGPYWSEEYSTFISPPSIVAIYSNGEQEQVPKFSGPVCESCGHLDADHNSAAGGLLFACQRLGCDCVKPAPAGGEAK